MYKPLFLKRKVIISVLSVVSLSTTAATIGNETCRANNNKAEQSLSDIAGIRTAGNGTTYNFARLAQMEDSGVKLVDNSCYLVERNDTIAAGDTFELDEGATVKFANNVTFVIQGKANLIATETQPVTLTRTDEAAAPNGIRIDNDEDEAEVSHVVFDQVGLEKTGRQSLSIDHCKFIFHNGSSAAALYFIQSGAESTISNCHFEQCAKAAIGSAANASQPMIINNCTFIRNSTLNRNIPQINITAAPLTIDHCTVEGDSTSQTINNMVGGIGISNFANFTDISTTISNCTITHNRYGIGTVGPINVRIEHNTILNNNHEANPMNGGSGISFYDPYKLTTAIVANNRIEGSHWGVTIIGCKDVNLGQPGNTQIDSPGQNIFNNNGCLGQLYDLYNNSTLTVYAQNNTWGVSEQTAEQIESVIFHHADNEQLGQVIYMSDEQLGITQKSANKGLQPSTVYSVQGILLKTQPYRGIYIKDGKKFAR